MIKSFIAATALLVILTMPSQAKPWQSKSWDVLNPTDVNEYMEWEFAHAPYFVGRILLDHDPVFTVYYTPTTKPEARLLVIHFIYALNEGYGYNHGPFEAYFLRIGTNVFLYDNYSKLETDLNYLSAHK